MIKRYDQRIVDQFWDIGLLDPGTGRDEREPDWSKYVVFSEASAGCSLGEFEQPLRGDLPLVNSTSILTECEVVQAVVQRGAAMKVSVARLNDDGTYTPRIVSSQSESNNNIMTLSQNRVSFSLVVADLLEGTQRRHPGIAPGQNP